MEKKYKALLIGEKSAGMMAVEIFENKNLFWSRRFDRDEIFDMAKVVKNVVCTMETCRNFRDWGFGDDEPEEYDTEETTGIHVRFENGFWYFGKDYGLGKEVLEFIADATIIRTASVGITQISKGWYLATAEHMTFVQKGWHDEDESKEKDFSVAPYWLWIDENLIPIHDSEDLINEMRGQA